MYQRESIDTLPAHLETTYGIAIAKVTQLDVGVFRVDRSDKGTPLVARLFSADRSYAAAEGDLAVLRYLAELGFPAERPYGDGPLTRHAGQAVLVTEFIKQTPKAKRPPYPIVRLGAMIGRLHGLPGPAVTDRPAGALPGPADGDRPAGALHHFAEGTLADELRAAADWLESVEASPAVDALRTALSSADGGDGLPEGFVHPDPVPKNVIFTADGPVLVDWTSAGRGPRLPSMTLVLKSGWAATPFLKGYTRVVTLTDEERARLPALLFTRRLIDLTFRTCRAPDTAPPNLKALRQTTEAQAQTLLSSVQP